MSINDLNINNRRGQKSTTARVLSHFSKTLKKKSFSFQRVILLGLCSLALLWIFFSLYWFSNLTHVHNQSLPTKKDPRHQLTATAWRKATNQQQNEIGKEDNLDVIQSENKRMYNTIDDLRGDVVVPAKQENHEIEPSKKRAAISQHIIPDLFTSKQIKNAKNSCDKLFGSDMIHPYRLPTLNADKDDSTSTDCIKHQTLGWVSCQVGTMLVDTSKIIGSVGGEKVEDVLGRTEEMELLKFHTGAFVLSKPLPPTLLQTVNINMKSALSSAIFRPLNSSSNTEMQNQQGVTEKTTFFVKRGDYANPCMAISVMYNVFVVMSSHSQFNKKLELTTDETQIVWLDGHARGNLDSVWKTLFGPNIFQVKQLGFNQDINKDHSLSKQHVQLDNVIIVNTISAIGDEGINKYRWGDQCHKESSKLHQFRDFVLHKFDIEQSKEKSYKKILTLLVRNDYAAHPRSNGRTDRTITNSTKEMQYLQSIYPNHDIEVVSFENKPFREQLLQIAKTDVLVSVHGAGNIHVLFLPKNAIMVEYFPPSFKARTRFKYLSQCLGIEYVEMDAFVDKRFSDGKISVRLH